MRKKSTLCIVGCLAVFAASGQPVLVSGYNGMASVNGTTYTKTGTAGNTAGAYGFVCASNDRGKFYGAWSARQYIYYIDAATFNVTDSINYTAYAISATNEPSTMFARTANGLTRINTATKTIVDSVAIGSAQFITERPNSKEVWVTSNNNIYVVNYSGAMAATSFTSSVVSTDNGDVRFAKGGSLAYKLAWTSKKVYKINASTKTIIDSIILSTAGGSLEVSADSSKVFVTFPSEKKVRIYSTATNLIIDSIDCGTREPFDIYRHPTRSEIWVVNHFKDSVTVFNENTYAQIAAFNVSTSPHSLAFGSATTGIDEQYGQISKNIVLYPNPTKNYITLTGAEASNIIKIFTITGKEVMSITATGKTENIDISPLPAGTYLLTTNKNGNKQYAASFIIE